MNNQQAAHQPGVAAVRAPPALVEVDARAVETVRALQTLRPFTSLLPLALAVTALGSMKHAEDQTRVREHKFFAVFSIGVCAIVTLVIGAVCSIAFLVIVASVVFSCYGHGEHLV